MTAEFSAADHLARARARAASRKRDRIALALVTVLGFVLGAWLAFTGWFSFVVSAFCFVVVPAVFTLIFAFWQRRKNAKDEAEYWAHEAALAEVRAQHKTDQLRQARARAKEDA